MNQDRIQRELMESKQRLIPTKIGYFQGQNRFLSNFWPAEVELSDMLFPTVEHAYQASKTLELSLQKQIQVLSTPGETKRLARTSELRPNWDKIKLFIIKDLVYQKFSIHPNLRKLLLATGVRILEEGNTWHDQFWGICHCKRCGSQGRNELGKILMWIRDQIKGEN